MFNLNITHELLSSCTSEGSNGSQNWSVHPYKHQGLDTWVREGAANLRMDGGPVAKSKDVFPRRNQTLTNLFVLRKRRSITVTPPPNRTPPLIEPFGLGGPFMRVQSFIFFPWNHPLIGPPSELDLFGFLAPHGGSE